MKVASSPRTPAIRPARSESAPSVALTVFWSMFSSVSGSAPVEISGARNLASDSVCPWMTAEPPAMPWLQLMVESWATGGWLMTTESRVIAISRLGSPLWLQAALPVRSSNLRAPAPEKSSRVCHWPVATLLCPPVVCSSAWAPVMSVPPSATGPICSLVAFAPGLCRPLSEAHSTVCAFGLSVASQVSWLAQSTLSNGGCLYLGSLAETSARTGRNCSCAVVPTARITSSEFRTSGMDTTRFPPSLATSDSATPLEFTRLRMMSIVVSICCLVGWPPLGLCGLKVTLVPPRRSSPSLGLMSKAMIAPQMLTTTTATATRGTTSRRVPGTASALLLLPRAASGRCGERRRSVSEQRVTVHGHAELAVETLRGPPAHHHAGQEDLEVLKDIGDLGIDLQLQRHRALLGVDAHERMGGREVHPIMDVELHLRVLAHAGAVDVGLVGDHHRGRHRRDGVAHLRQDRHGDERRGLRVVPPADDVADVVQVAGHAGQLGQLAVAAEPVEDVEGDVAHQIGVAEAVLGVAELAGELIGESEVGLHHLVARHVVQQMELAGPALARDHGLVASGSSDSSCPSDSSASSES